MNKIFWTSIEYIEINLDPKNKIIGGFVYAFLNSKNESEALKMFTSALLEQNKSIKVVEFISLYPEILLWEDQKHTEHYKNLSKLADTTDQVIFDDFYAYQK